MKKIIFLSILFFLATVANSYACTCIGGKRSIKKALRKNDVVFLGEVISEEIIIYIHSKDGGYFKSEFRFKKFTFRVQKIFKGRIKGDTVSVITGMGHGDCGFPFEIGKKYVVYSVWQNRFIKKGEKVNKFLTTHICKRTTSRAKEEEAAINRYFEHWKWLKKIFINLF